MSHADAPKRRNWPWVVAVIGGVVVIIVAASVISNLLAASGSSTTSPSPTRSATPTPTLTSTPSPTPTPTPTKKAKSLSAKRIAAIETAVADDKPAGLYDYLTDPVRVTFAASDFDKSRSPDNAIIDLQYIDGSSGWDWAPGDDQIAQFQAGPYAQYFGAGTIIGESANGYVISFQVKGNKISGVFVSNSTDVVVAQ